MSPYKVLCEAGDAKMNMSPQVPQSLRRHVDINPMIACEVNTRCAEINALKLRSFTGG